MSQRTECDTEHIKYCNREHTYGKTLRDILNT
jgi:hypothetical protein